MRNPFRAKRREPMAVEHPQYQAHIDFDLPYMVSTDHAIWGTFADPEDAVRLADTVGNYEPVGERVFVTMVGIVFYRTTGTNQHRRQATKDGRFS